MEVGVQKRRRFGSHKQYAILKSLEGEVAALREALRQEEQRQQEIIEQNLVLAELLHLQELTAAVQEKHQRLIASGGLAQSPGQQQQQQQQQQQVQTTGTGTSGCSGFQQTESDAPCGTHWVEYLLETATWEQVQQALSMSCADWMSHQKQYVADLATLMEVRQRCPEVQDFMLAGVKQSIPAQNIPGTYAASSSCTASSSGHTSSRADGSTGADSLLADDVIVHMLKTTGILVHLAFLHGAPALFEAGSKNLHTGQQCTAPPLHWVSVAQRMGLSKQQKLYMKLALQVFARKAKAAAAQGMSILQEASSYSFLLACKAIAAQQLAKGECVLQPQGPLTGAVGAAGTGAGQAACTSTRSSAGAGATQRAPTAGQTTGPTPGHVSGPKRAATQVGSVSARSDIGNNTAGSEPQQGDAKMGVGEALQREVALFYRSMKNVFIFLADTLTLEQALLLNVASYPYFPLIGAVADAAIQLPDDPTAEQGPQQQGAHRLMFERRRSMQHTQYLWWND